MIDWLAAERYFDRTVGEDNAGDTRRRGFSVVGSTPDVAKADPGRPLVGDPHPDDAALVIQTVSFSPTGYGALVIAQYGLSEFSGGPPPENVQDDAYFTIDTSFEDVNVDIPVFQQVTKLMFTASGTGPPSEQTVYQPVETRTFRYTRSTHRVTLNVDAILAATVPAQLAFVEQIMQQANKIHRINGRDLLFKPDNARRFTPEKRQFTYRWISDPGIPNTLTFEETVNPTRGSASAQFGRIGSILYPFTTVGGDEFILPPFSRLQTGPVEDDDPTQVPVLYYTDNHKRANNGYLTLPGVV